MAGSSSDTPLVRPVFGKAPRLGARVYLAETAVVVGDVELGEDASVWFGSVLRGDVGWIRVGARSNIQDGSIVHMTRGVSNAWIEEDVTIGHGVIVHGARVRSGALVGMGSVLLDEVDVGEQAWVAAGSLLPPRMRVPPRTLVKGRPATVARELTPEECLEGARLAAHYVELARAHAAERSRP
ncbi:MAG TPA: gamma carbonic anhydrase family protein [Polyangiaceae bacterium]|nr:MAG: gamma carbonic anhydrase family protein [Pseudomonadota bacterium]HLV66859.1 gamma carbonic anhydrase family protein [Polyangiaceae bacterium]